MAGAALGCRGVSFASVMNSEAKDAGDEDYAREDEHQHQDQEQQDHAQWDSLVPAVPASPVHEVAS
jgi:hypothetical protein